MLQVLARGGNGMMDSAGDPTWSSGGTVFDAVRARRPAREYLCSSSSPWELKFVKVRRGTTSCASLLSQEAPGEKGEHVLCLYSLRALKRYHPNVCTSMLN